MSRSFYRKFRDYVDLLGYKFENISGKKKFAFLAGGLFTGTVVGSVLASDFSIPNYQISVFNYEMMRSNMEEACLVSELSRECIEYTRRLPIIDPSSVITRDGADYYAAYSPILAKIRGGATGMGLAAAAIAMMACNSLRFSKD